MTKSLLFTAMGFGWFAYISVPLIVADCTLIAQGMPPDITIKDIANVGGFAIFAWAMYRQNIKQTDAHREDLASERKLRESAMERDYDHREKMIDALNKNTAATVALCRVQKDQA